MPSTVFGSTILMARRAVGATKNPLTLCSLMILKNIKKKTYKQLLAYDYTCSLKVRKFQNEYMKSSQCPKYEPKITKTLP